MLKIVQSWVERYFSDEQAIVLASLIAIGFGVILLWGDILAPVLASIIIAFVLQGAVSWLNKRGLPQLLSVTVVFSAFLSAIFALIFAVLPLVYSQFESLVNDFPKIVSMLRVYGDDLQERFPAFFQGDEITLAYQQLSEGSAQVVQWIFSHSLSTLPVIVSVMIYLIVVPILVFFLLKDRKKILMSIDAALPSKKGLIQRVSLEMNEQFSNYLRGKAIEIFVVAVFTYIVLQYFGLNYAALLSMLVGLSVLIPYIGAIVVTIPVALIALFQFGLTDEFYYVLIAYFVVQAIDGNVLVPLLFSEVVNLHPILIIVAVLFFGGVWGFWGVFFAIPLATLVKAVVTAWPRVDAEA